jgi:hypothetical protein
MCKNDQPEFTMEHPGKVLAILIVALLAGSIVAWRLLNPPPPAVVTVSAARHPSEVEVCRSIAMRPNWRAGVEERLHDDLDGKHAGQSRIDIITATHVYEADWAHKWPEAVGQSLYYAHQWAEEHPRDPRKPGIVLLVRDPERESHFVSRCRRVCDQYAITLVVETVR